ncbi:MAG: response regulator [Bacteroidota bacterium]
MEAPNAHVLIIEDNEEVRENLAEILELYGYQVTTAPDGLAGVKTALEQPPDIILCVRCFHRFFGFH